MECVAERADTVTQKFEIKVHAENSHSSKSWRFCTEAYFESRARRDHDISICVVSYGLDSHREQHAVGQQIL
jgi:hypothetical protein